MKKQKNASSIIEAMVVLLVVITGIVGVYSLLDASLKLSNSTAHRIEAIQIARDGLEAMTNIRDTNWLLFSADTNNCWNTLNYNTNCVGTFSTLYDIKMGATDGFRIYRDITDNRFRLSIQSFGLGTDTITDSGYRNLFRVNKDSSGFYTQSGGISFNPIYTRDIRIEYIDTDGNATADAFDEKMRVTAIVQWMDSGNSSPKRLEMSTILANWKQ